MATGQLQQPADFHKPNCLCHPEANLSLTRRLRPSHLPLPKHLRFTNTRKAACAARPLLTPLRYLQGKLPTFQSGCVCVHLGLRRAPFPTSDLFACSAVFVLSVEPTVLQVTGEDDPVLGTGVGAPGFGTQSLAQANALRRAVFEVWGGGSLGHRVQQQLKSPPCRLCHCLKPLPGRICWDGYGSPHQPQSHVPCVCVIFLHSYYLYLHLYERLDTSEMLQSAFCGKTGLCFGHLPSNCSQ